jgi:hypothetical protein
MKGKRRAVLLSPGSEGVPRLELRHVKQVADKGQAAGARREREKGRSLTYQDPTGKESESENDGEHINR